MYQGGRECTPTSCCIHLPLPKCPGASNCIPTMAPFYDHILCLAELLLTALKVDTRRVCSTSTENKFLLHRIVDMALILFFSVLIKESA